MIPMMLVMGLVLDGGLVFLAHRNARNVADAAVLEAAKQVALTLDSGADTSQRPYPCTNNTLRTAGPSYRPAVDKACDLAEAESYLASEVSVSIDPTHGDSSVINNDAMVQVSIARAYTP